uniref:Uncharacterized protein n=1 Tax=Ananas comosus var. bracteatus TaxID=296719 RepID=A0A6V7PGQ4_ANACO|nr:unnamed protein product [Ananas comosus var. bracteatus]
MLSSILRTSPLKELKVSGISVYLSPIFDITSSNSARRSSNDAKSLVIRVSRLLLRLEGCFGGSPPTLTTPASDDDMVPPRTSSDTNYHGLSVSIHKAHAAPVFLLKDGQAFVPVASLDLRVLRLNMQRE